MKILCFNIEYVGWTRNLEKEVLKILKKDYIKYKTISKTNAREYIRQVTDKNFKQAHDYTIEIIHKYEHWFRQ